ncbi:hypothetical protein F511_15429 [Dorcoceras hygrometricum]|uniref:Uncharacterized protein n=1 Tax=Dorcoceras hygrometricum TaxID=472368 RepID=A0A2Z7CE17_9LAMI|nr:hypothetical protein F511_15429 [Dorcoceras hygrometricum]
MLTIVLDKDLECTIVYVRCDSGYDGYHEIHLIVTVYSELVPSRLSRQNTRNAIEALHDRRLTLTRLPTHLGSLGAGLGEVPMHSTGCVLGKWVYLVTLAMSLFDLQDICIVIGSLATLDLPMIVDLIGIYVLKGPYCTLTMTNWFLQALSEIPRGSWGDVARRFTMIRWRTLNQKNSQAVCLYVVTSTTARGGRLLQANEAVQIRTILPNQLTPSWSWFNIKIHQQTSKLEPEHTGPVRTIAGSCLSWMLDRDGFIVDDVEDEEEEEQIQRQNSDELEEKAIIEGIQMSPSVSSVAGVGTSSFGLVGTTAFWISEGDSAVSSVGLQLCERPDVGYHGFSAGRGVDLAGGAPGGG